MVAQKGLLQTNAHHGPSCELRASRFSVELKFQDEPSVAILIDEILERKFEIIFEQIIGILKRTEIYLKN